MERLDLDQIQTDFGKLIHPEWGEAFEVRRNYPDSGVSGFLALKQWLGVSFPERQKQLDEILRNLYGEAAEDVSLILTFTPEEYEAWAEDRVAA
jgi:hypothetical protein